MKKYVLQVPADPDIHCDVDELIKAFKEWIVHPTSDVIVLTGVIVKVVEIDLTDPEPDVVIERV